MSIIFVLRFIGLVEYFLQKQIITSDVMDDSHSYYNMKQRILDTSNEFNLSRNVFLRTLDNVS